MDSFSSKRYQTVLLKFSTVVKNTKIVVAFGGAHAEIVRVSARATLTEDTSPRSSLLCLLWGTTRSLALATIWTSFAGDRTICRVAALFIFCVFFEKSFP